MSVNNNFPPASPDNSDDDAAAERKRQNKELLEAVNDPAVNAAVNLVDNTANGGLVGGPAEDFVGGVSSLVEMAGNHQDELPDDASDLTKGLWQGNPQLRQLCEESARYDSLSDDEKKAFDDKINDYWKVMHRLSDALDQGVTFDEVEPDNATADSGTPEADAASGTPEADNAAQEQTPEEIQLKNIEDYQAAVKRYTDLLKTKMGLDAELRSLRGEIAIAADGDDVSAQTQRNAELEAQIPRLNGEILKARNETLSRGLLLNAVYGNWGGAPNTAGADNENSQTPEQDTVAEHFAKYNSAMAEYAELKADAETKAKGFGINFKLFGHNISRQSGREKREPALIEAENNLKASAINYIKARVEKKKQNGEYEGTEDEINQKMSDEAFDLMRGLLDNNVRKATNDVLTERQEKRKFGKVLAYVGSYLNDGGKWSRRFKNGVPGFAIGLGLSLASLGWPISTAVSAVAVGAVRRSSRLAAIDENLKAHQDEQGNAKGTVSDEEYATYRRSGESRQDLSKGMEYLAGLMLAASKKNSYDDSDKASKEARKNVTAFGVGAALGAVAGISFNILNSDVSATQNTNGKGAGGDLNKTPPNGAGKQIGTGDIGGGGAPLQPPDFSTYSNQYPWNWAANTFGIENATPRLQELAAAAAQDGHTVEWIGSGTGQRLKIDGVSDTVSVISKLNKYV